MANVFVVGCVSLDTLHFAGQTVSTMGGAGLYTALAAQYAGATVTLSAPRPQPLPEQFNAVAARLRWVGPQITPGEMPRLEIIHHGGGRATLLDAAWGGEAALTPDCLADELQAYDVIHVAGLSSAQKQLDFLHACRRRGAQRLSAGTYARAVYGETNIVQALFDEADIFFMNENEANGLFGSAASAQTRPGKVLFITQGGSGATVYESTQGTHIAAAYANELDPTGAGDTFCGATLASLLGGHGPIEAARRAARLAARCVEAPGPAALL